MTTLKLLDSVEVKGKSVLLRAGFDVPIKKGRILDDTRIREGLATIRLLIERKVDKITIITHIGRPNGKVNQDLSTSPIARYLKRMFKGDFARIKVEENLRFDSREQLGKTSFARQLAKGHNLFVQDAFSVLHRRDASIVKLPRLLPHCGGLLVKKEIDTLTDLLSDLSRYSIIVGGAKLEEKLPFVSFALKRAKRVLIGGKVANALLKNHTNHHKINNKLFLPVDGVTTNGQVKKIASIRHFNEIADLGPKTIQEYTKIILDSPRIFWVGNLGKSEEVAFARASLQIAKALASITGKVIVAGGDTLAFLSQAGLLGRFKFYSTGGGATLEYLRLGGKLPGLEALA